MMSSSDPLIHLTEVKKVFYTDEVETHALSGIHLDIKKGEYLSNRTYLGIRLAANSNSEISQRLLVEDFVFFRQALEEVHAGLYRYTSREEMNATFEAAKRMIDREMDALEFYRVLAPDSQHQWHSDERYSCEDVSRD